MPVDIEKNLESLEHAASERGGPWVVILALLRSRYFLFSLVFYLMILVLFGGYVVSVYIPMRGIFGDTDVLLVLPERTPPPPPAHKKETKAETQDVKVSATTPSAKMVVTRLTVDAPSAFVQTETPVLAPTVKPAGIKVDTKLPQKIEAARIRRLVGVRDFQKWKVRDNPNRKYVRAEFTIFQAKYHDGDWNCNPGSVANLLLQIRRWSRDRLKANLYPKVLDIGTEELFEIRPPFIYLTGHKNFYLLDTEVKNIRDYLMLGGCVWADSALAGRLSRFDIAFRREMKRIMPDRDFETVPPDHEMFNTFFRNVELPTGMNYYQEPIEMINIGNELAVLYTLNGYGHFWETRLNQEGKIEWGLVNIGELGKPRWVHVYGPHLRGYQSGILYRNINDETVRESYKFGINVVVHLLVRYQKYFRFLPKELPSSTVHRRRDKRKTPEASTNELSAKPKRVHKKIGGTNINTGKPLVKPGLLK